MLTAPRIPDRSFLAVAPAAAVGGAAWNLSHLPLGWLMGAALVTGVVAMMGVAITVPAGLHKAALIVIGTGVGLALSPDVAVQIVTWAPVMGVAAVLGIAMAALMAPLLERFGKVDRATAYFSLLPGGVIEMANIAGRFGADRTTIAALHTVRVALVVVLLPLALFSIFEHGSGGAASIGAANSGWVMIAAALAVGTFGGWLGARLHFPAAWLLGAVIAVGIASGSGEVGAKLPGGLLALAQITVGMTLGSRFDRRRLATIPRALAVGVPVLITIIVVMALFAALCALFMPVDLSTLVLSFAIGGMAEMVLTAKALHQDVALVAAFQAVRGIAANALAGPIWIWLTRNRTK
ncbi:hypothetical protein BMG03_19700 (plasmid) [Thioclava nitratireducens]|uniref:AbrB family transcriptional regulator n=1 Tax=Thioclava nitratireducens TaxID=1915078 RepID=A0ABM6IMF4_9RHOB|nr:hypothetical protein BMG03_19700 [Thioclava nitratireducens]